MKNINITRPVASVCPSATSPKTVPHPTVLQSYSHVSTLFGDRLSKSENYVIVHFVFQYENEYLLKKRGTSWLAIIKSLSVAVFERSMLATHGLPGKLDYANMGSQAKPILGPVKVELILGKITTSVLFIYISSM